MPQSMQRAPCAFRSGSASGSWYSMKSCTRCSTGRFGPLTRWISRKPPISPIARQDLLGGLLLDLLLLGRRGAASAGVAPGASRRDGGVLVLPSLAGRDRLLMPVARRVRRALAGLDGARAVVVAALADHRGLARLHGPALCLLAQRALVVDRHDLHPGAAELIPPVEDPRGDRRVRKLAVLLDERADRVEVLVVHLLELDELRVAARGELALGIEDVGDAATHARGEVAPGRTEHDHAPAGHVLAAVIADSLDDSLDAGVAHREALPREPAEERPAAGRAVQDRVADHHVLLGHIRRVLRRAHGQDAARETLARVVVGVAVEHQRHAAHQPAAEALPAVAARAHDDRVVRQALGPVAPRDLARQEPADTAVLVLHPHLDLDLL